MIYLAFLHFQLLTVIFFVRQLFPQQPKQEIW